MKRARVVACAGQGKVRKGYCRSEQLVSVLFCRFAVTAKAERTDSGWCVAAADSGRSEPVGAFLLRQARMGLARCPGVRFLLGIFSSIVVQCVSRTVLYSSGVGW